MPWVVVGLAAPLTLIIVWRRWQDYSVLIWVILLFPILGGLILFSVGLLLGWIDQTNPTKANKPSAYSREFLIVLLAIGYGMFGAVFTLAIFFLTGWVWFFWRRSHPQSFWKMVYFRHQDRADILKDYDEHIKPETPPQDQTIIELPPKE